MTGAGNFVAMQHMSYPDIDLTSVPFCEGVGVLIIALLVIGLLNS